MWKLQVSGSGNFEKVNDRLVIVLAQFNSQAVAYGQTSHPPDKFHLGSQVKKNKWTFHVGDFTNKEVTVRALELIRKRLLGHGIDHLGRVDWVGSLELEIERARLEFSDTVKDVPGAHEPNHVMAYLRKNEIPFTAEQLKKITPDLFA